MTETLMLKHDTADVLITKSSWLIEKKLKNGKYGQNKSTFRFSSNSTKWSSEKFKLSEKFQEHLMQDYFCGLGI